MRKSGRCPHRTIDGYWGLLKRGIISSLHQVSIKHLHRYLSEFQFRWNNREAHEHEHALTEPAGSRDTPGSRRRMIP